MRVTQVSSDYVAKNMDNDNLYRVFKCDDSHGNTGKKHYSVRLKPVRNMTIAEYTESIDNPMYGFIMVEEE